MIENETLKDIIYRYKNDICHWNERMIYALQPGIKNDYIDRIEKRTEEFVMEMDQLIYKVEAMQNSNNNPQQTFTVEELAEFDGSHGKAAYVAVNGVVYDLSKMISWAGGTHFGLYSGKDLTKEFMGCHQGIMAILEKLPKVGVLK